MAKKEKFARSCKERMVNEVLARFEKHPDFIVTSYMGSTVSDLEQLRRTLRKMRASYFVVKNSILKVVFEKLKLKDEALKIDGGVGISLSGDDILATCKALAHFSKDHAKFKITSGVIDGKSVTSERITHLASLPSKEILLSRMVGGMKSPITGFVNTLSGVLSKFVRVVDAIKTAKGQTA